MFITLLTISVKIKIVLLIRVIVTEVLLTLCKYNVDIRILSLRSKGADGAVSEQKIVRQNQTEEKASWEKKLQIWYQFYPYSFEDSEI